MQKLVNDLLVDQPIRSLQALSNILEIASHHAKEKKFDENNYLNLRFSPDMFTFCRQIQISTDMAKGAVARLTGKTAPVFDDKEATLEELKNRVQKTINFLNEFKNAEFQGWENKEISFPWYPGKKLTGYNYLVTHFLPNFYFHLTTAYDLLRANGIQLGKANFLGNQPWENA